MKRDYSDMDSESDDVFGEDSKGTPSQSNDSCQMLNRKRRRGIIEKRRRDRINNSLSELRRLVPAAFEKQGSAKLEKAEILQLTVDHLKMLHAKGFDALSFDPHKFAMDYHSIGFRECASEVARYLVAMEGMDLQDPLRLRLMSHLQCYSAQRELAMKSPASTVHNHWNPPPPPSFSSIAPPPPAAPTPQYPPPPPMTGGHVSSPNLGPTVSLSTDSTSLSTCVPSYNCTESRLTGHSVGPLDNNGPLSTGHYTRLTPTTVSASTASSSMTSTLVSNSGVGTMVPPPPSLPQMSGNQYLSGHSFAPTGYGPPGHFNQHMSSTGRPYRPWGAELAY